MLIVDTADDPNVSTIEHGESAVTRTLVAKRAERGTIRSAVAVGLVIACACVTVTAGVLMAVLDANDGVSGRLPVSLRVPSFTEVVLPCVQDSPLVGLTSCEPAAKTGQWPGGERLPVTRRGDLSVDTIEVGAGVSLLSTSAAWAGLIALGVGALVLVPVLRTTSGGQPFARGNVHRLAAAATVVASAWIFATVGPFIAAGVAIRDLERAPRMSVNDVSYDMPVGWLVPDLQITWWPLLVIALLVGLAAATRQGARMAADVEGLV